MWRKLALLGCLAFSAFAQDLSNASSIQWTKELTGPWRWHTGDDLRWASPSFDDSNWPVFKLPGPPPNQLNYWIRIPVQLDRVSDPGVLVGPIAQAYEAYWDGQHIGKLGDGPPHSKWFAVRPLVFRIPVQFAQPGPHVIAFRVFDSLSRRWGRPAWVSPSDNRVGSASALMDASAAQQGAFLFQRSVLIFIDLVLVLVGVYFVFLPRAIAGGSAFLWFGLCLLAQGSGALGNFYFTFGPPVISGRIMGQALFTFLCVSYVFAIDFAYAMFRRRVPLAVRCVQAANVVSALFAMAYGPLPWQVAYKLLITTGVILSMLGAIFAAIEFRRRSPGAALALSLFAIWAFVTSSSFLNQLFGTSIPTTFQVAGFRVSCWDLSLFLWIPAITVELHRVNQRLRDDRQRLQGEMEAARRVQEILLPSKVVRVRGFEIDSAYLPADEVGGDFFQLFPAADDSLLVVVGDVSGKGMKAALLVSLIVGALQNRKSDQPASILSELNSALLGRSEGGFTTCCCALFAPDGTLTLANAGHLAPYCNGKEIETAPGLPLGVVTGVHWDDVCLELQPGDRIVWMSDGIVEARNGKRDLLGFTRAQELAGRPVSEIARAAQDFGQEDDITVVSITRQPVPAYVA